MDKLTPKEIRKAMFENAEKEKCRKKERYPSLELAENRAKTIMSQGRKGFKLQRVYKCPWCGYFHLTTNQRSHLGRG